MAALISVSLVVTFHLLSITMRSIHAGVEESPQLDRIFQYIDSNQDEFIAELGKAVAIRNVSPWMSQPSIHTALWTMINQTQAKLTGLGFSVSLQPVGASTQKMEDGSELPPPLPPVIFATLSTTSRKSTSTSTLLIYGHLDVAPAQQSDGWSFDPFILTPRDGALYGRGTTDDKGPVLAWIHAVQAFVQSGFPLPINIKMILESCEEFGSAGLEALLVREKAGFLADVNIVAISDTYWLGREIPTLTYGLRGLVSFEAVVTGGSKDLHSGQGGGVVYEPIDDLIWILAQIKGRNGDILIPGIMEGVDPVKSESYTDLDFSLEDFKNSSGGYSLIYPESKELFLRALWHRPSLTIHGIEGAFSEAGFKTVIPSRVSGKFSLRIPPSQNPDRVSEIVTSFMRRTWREGGSRNKFEINSVAKESPWLADPTGSNFLSAGAAIRRVYGREAQFVREGVTIPIARLLEELTNCSVVLIPLGQSDDGAHSQDEKIGVRNYIEGTKVFAAYFVELGLRRK